MREFGSWEGEALDVLTCFSVRFPVEPFCLSYEVMHKNSTYVPKPVGDDARLPANKIEWHFTQSQKKTPAAYLESALGGASFFSKVEVEVNGYAISEVSGPSLGNHGWAGWGALVYGVAGRSDRPDYYKRSGHRVFAWPDRAPARASLYCRRA